MNQQLSTKYFPVKLSGEVSSIETCKALGRFLRICLLSGFKNVAVDWSDVTEISGSLAGFIIVAHNKFKSASGEIILANPSKQVEEIFCVVGLESMIVDNISFPSNHNKLTLVVEDDAYVREITEEYLKEAGFITIGAENGKTGLTYFELLHRQLDLVVTDVEMPEMDGLSFFKETIKTNSNVPFIVTTGYTHSGKIGEFHSIQPTMPILRKPFLQSELTDAIDKFVIPSPYRR